MTLTFGLEECGLVVIESVEDFLSGLTLGLLTDLWNTSLNLRAGDFPLARDASTWGLNVSDFPFKCERGGRAGTFCKAGDLGEVGTLRIWGRSTITGKASVDLLTVMSSPLPGTVVVVIKGEVVVK